MEETYGSQSNKRHCPCCTFECDRFYDNFRSAKVVPSLSSNDINESDSDYSTDSRAA